MSSAGGRAAAPDGLAAADVSCLWDAHACLNTLSRCLLSGALAPAEDELLYVLSGHMRLLAQICQSGGWVSPGRLQEWLDTLVALQPDAPGPGACRISLPANRVRQLQILPLGTALQPLLHQARPLAGISIEAGELNFAGGADSIASLPLRLRVSEGRRDTQTRPDAATQALREWGAQVVCECTLVH